jgi:flagellar biosynthetic protein FlhB
MAEELYRDDLERSEEPTPKRREEARKKGQVAKSRLVIPAATLVAIMIALYFGGRELVTRTERLFIGFFALASAMKPLERDALLDLSVDAGLLFAPVLLPFFGGIVVAGLASGLAQTGFVFSSEALRFNLARLNPFTGLSRIFGADAAAEMVKSVVILGGLGMLGFFYLYASIRELIVLTDLGVAELSARAIQEGYSVVGFAIALMSVLAASDYLYQRWRMEKQLRMSRQEIKEELREQEGDPQLKGVLKGMRQKLARRRMMADVPKADVIITNPTELAVAVRYRSVEMAAPKVLAKGAGFIAQRIREIARENGIPIVENKSLARLLFRQVDLGQEIPEALYRAVAGVLAYVYRLRRGGMNGNVQAESRAGKDKAPETSPGGELLE